MWLGSDESDPVHQLLAGASVSSEQDGEVWTTGFSITVQVGGAAGARSAVGCKEDGQVWTADFAVTIEVFRTLIGFFAISRAAGGIFACIADSVTTDWAAAFTLFGSTVTTVSVVAAEVSAVLLGSTVAVTVTDPELGPAFAGTVTVSDFADWAAAGTASARSQVSTEAVPDIFAADAVDQADRGAAKAVITTTSGLLGVARFVILVATAFGEATGEGVAAAASKGAGAVVGQSL